MSVAHFSNADTAFKTDKSTFKWFFFFENHIH